MCLKTVFRSRKKSQPGHFTRLLGWPLTPFCLSSLAECPLSIFNYSRQSLRLYLSLLDSLFGLFFFFEQPSSWSFWTEMSTDWLVCSPQSSMSGAFSIASVPDLSPTNKPFVRLGTGTGSETYFEVKSWKGTSQTCLNLGLILTSSLDSDMSGCCRTGSSSIWLFLSLFCSYSTYSSWFYRSKRSITAGRVISYYLSNSSSSLTLSFFS